MEYILASKSPRRKELFSLLVPQFSCETAEVDERAVTIMRPDALCLALAKLKCRAVAAAHPDCCVIGSDTMVAVDGKLLGKPADREDELRMLRMLSGRDHQVMTGLTVLRGSRVLSHTEVTHIHFRNLSEREIRRYVATGEPMDKAGSYAIQGGAALFAEKMNGDYYNVMGLPVCRLWQMLRAIAPDIMEDFQ